MSENNEIMEVMMTGGDGGSMNEETLSQVVNMLQMEGQLGHGNQTIIIRQPGSNEVQMIQASSNGSEVVVTKASEEEIEALQLNNGIGAINTDLLEENPDEPVVMMDEGGNLVQGVVQIDNAGSNQRHRLDNGLDVKNDNVNQLLDGLVDLDGDHRQTIPNNGLNFDVQLAEPLKDRQFTLNAGNKFKRKPIVNDKVVSIKINTGLDSKRKLGKQEFIVPKNVIKISTVTGQQKYQPPKFHKCDSCAINFVSKVAYLNHMENCPSKRKSSLTTGKSNLTYTCVFCETKFTSRLVLMQHVRTCEKARSTKTFNSASKIKANTTSESKLSSISDQETYSGRGSRSRGRGRGRVLGSERGGRGRGRGRKYSFDDGNLINEPRLDSEEEDERFVIYDDEDDDEELNEEMVDDVVEDEKDSLAASKKSQKHLGPIVINGVFKCRDCSRTFGKEPQYNRHIKVCTNSPLSIAHADAFDQMQLSTEGGMKRKRSNSGSSDEGVGSPYKKRQMGEKIIPVESVNKSRKSVTFPDLPEIDSKIVKLSRLPGSQSTKFAAKAAATLGMKKNNPENNFMGSNESREDSYLGNIPLCGLCGEKFKESSELALHTQSTHSEDLLNLRDLLDGKGSSSSLKCPLCSFHFINSHTLLFHLVSIHLKELKSVNDELTKLNLCLKCPFCKKICLSQDLLKEHIASKHLDMLSSKPTANTIAVPVDVNILIKENDESALTAKSVLSNMEKVLCPDCGLFFIKSYFEHHRCACEIYSPTARRFVCSESQCVGMTFYKLIHLLTHLQQVHDKSLTGHLETFDSLTKFLDWLKMKEASEKMKYTKAMQRMKQGKLSSVWVCHRFHNAMKDPITGNKDSLPQQKVDRLQHCYSRIQVETNFSSFTLRYDGETTIKFFSEHQHSSSTEKSEETVLPPKEENVKDPTEEVVVPQTLTQQHSAFSSAEELKQLLEDDEIGETPDLSSMDDGDPLSLTNAPSIDSMEMKGKEDGEEKMEELQNIVNDEPGDVDKLEKELVEALAGDHVQNTVELKHVDEEPPAVIEPKPAQDDLQTPQKSDLSSFTDTDLLLEKMLSGVSNVVDTINSVSTPIEDIISASSNESSETKPTEEESEKSDTCCANAKSEVSESHPLPSLISDVAEDNNKILEKEDEESNSKFDEILESFGVGPSSRPSSVTDFVTATTTEAIDEVVTTMSNEEKDDDEKLDEEVSAITSNVVKESDKKQDLNESTEQDSELEESTYVLPADNEEWQKLFELVQSQVNGETLMNNDLKEAKNLLTYEKRITNIPVEEQVQVFNSLCTLANVQMS